MARNEFSHIRLHRLSKGRPDSLVNPILLRQPWSGWCVERHSVSVDPTRLPPPFLPWLPGLFGHSDLPTNLPARPARELAEESPACLGPPQVVASPWSCDLPLTDTALEHAPDCSHFPFLISGSSELTQLSLLIISVAVKGRAQFQGRIYARTQLSFLALNQESEKASGPFNSF